jgi:tungstate transport system substrate-binding protein
MFRANFIWAVVSGFLLSHAVEAQQVASVDARPFIVLASTTSTQDSGLFRHLLPAFSKTSGIDVRVVALGTGQALDLARRGDADAVLVHDSAAEEKFVADGFAEARFDVMYNDFVLLGPLNDPAKAGSLKDILQGLRNIHLSGSKGELAFVSRGDKSGTHAAEGRLWKSAGLDPLVGKGQWYRETGSGMGPSLNTASAMNAYILADRGTWAAFKNRGELKILLEGDKRLFNQYGVMAVSSKKHPHVKNALAKTFVNWLVSSEGQASIAQYRVGSETLFFPNATK